MTGRSAPNLLLTKSTDTTVSTSSSCYAILFSSVWLFLGVVDGPRDVASVFSLCSQTSDNKRPEQPIKDLCVW